MNKYLRSVLLAVGTLCLSLALVACNKSEDASIEQRRSGESAFRTFVNDSTNYQRVTVGGITGNNFVLMLLERPSGSNVTIDYTDLVSVAYNVYRASDWIDNSTTARSYSPSSISIDKTNVQAGDIRNLPIGLQIALQNLHEGDEARVVLPWYLAYGSTVYGALPSYSAVVIRLKVLRVRKTNVAS